jgi:hypothetical protein
VPYARRVGDATSDRSVWGSGRSRLGRPPNTVVDPGSGSGRRSATFRSAGASLDRAHGHVTFDTVAIRGGWTGGECIVRGRL